MTTDPLSSRVPSVAFVFALRMGEGTPDRFNPRYGRDDMHPHKGWYADPFPPGHDGDLFCFFEDLPHGSDKARIGVARVRENRLEFLASALETGYHSSFPFVFNHEGEIFMLLETIDVNRVEVWKATDFPLGWTRHAVALEGQQFADPVLLEHDGAWWLFATPRNDSIGDFNSELWLFRVAGPDLKKNEPHPLNPAAVGSDTARGGGRVLCIDGRFAGQQRQDLRIWPEPHACDDPYRERLRGTAHSPHLPRRHSRCSGMPRYRLPEWALCHGHPMAMTRLFDQRSDQLAGLQDTGGCMA